MKTAYIGIENKPRKIRQIYIGIDNISHRVKKAYIGVGGIARPYWGGESKIEYYGQTALNRGVGKHSLAAVTIVNQALFGGGTSNSGSCDTVDAYDTSLTRKEAPSLAS